MIDAIAARGAPWHAGARLQAGLILSLLVHAFILSLQFGMPGLGLPGLDLPWHARRAETPSLSVVLSRPPSESAVAPATIDPAPFPASSPPSPVAQPAVRAEGGLRMVPEYRPPASAAPAGRVPTVKKARRAAPPPRAPSQRKLIASLDAPDAKFAVAPPDPDLPSRQAAAEGDDAVQAAPAPEPPIPAPLPPEPPAPEPDHAALAREEAERQTARVAQEQERAAADMERQAQAARQQALAQERQAQAEQERQRLEQERRQLAAMEQQRLAAIDKAREDERAARLRQEQEEQQRELARRQEAEQQAAMARQQEAARRQAEQAAAQQRERERDSMRAAQGAARDTAPLSRAMTGGLAGGLAARALEQARQTDLLRADPPARNTAPATGDAETPRRRSVFGSIDRDVGLKMYIDSWRQKIERNGSLNYAQSSRDKARGDPVVTVAIRSDGSIEDIVIHRSSGRPELDEAVRRIARINARYAAFPPALARKYDVIEIRRIWSFDDSLRLLEELH